MRNRIIRYLCYCVVAVLLSGCYPLRRIGLVQERDGLPVYEQGEFKQYKLNQNDEVELRVITSNAETAKLFRVTSSTTTMNTSSSFPYRIYEDGTIDIPFLKRVHIEGLTLEEAEDKIESLLVEFVDDVRVKLSLSTGTFCVIGDAGRGYYPIYKERMTIFQALALCGGLNESADFGHVKILRTDRTGTKIVEFDVRSKSIIDSEYYYIYPNDVIYVDVSKRRFWGVSSYSTFLGVISSSLNILVTVWNTFD